MADFKNYDPGSVVFSFNGIRAVGYADGTFIMAERAEDGFTTNVGAAGDVARVRNRNRMGSVTLTLQQTSPSNDQYSAIADTDELFGTGYGTLIVKDLLGNTLIEAPQAWIRKKANAEFGKDHSNREWIFDCAELFMANGGAVI